MDPDDIKKELEQAMQGGQEEKPAQDPFAEDGLGRVPAKEDDGGSESQ